MHYQNNDFPRCQRVLILKELMQWCQSRYLTTMFWKENVAHWRMTFPKIQDNCSDVHFLSPLSRSWGWVNVICCQQLQVILYLKYDSVWTCLVYQSGHHLFKGLKKKVLVMKSCSPQASCLTGNNRGFRVHFSLPVLLNLALQTDALNFSKLRCQK